MASSQPKLVAGAFWSYRMGKDGGGKNVVSLETQAAERLDAANYAGHFGRKANLAVWGLSWQEIMALEEWK